MMVHLKILDNLKSSNLKTLGIGEKKSCPKGIGSIFNKRIIESIRVRKRYATQYIGVFRASDRQDQERNSLCRIIIKTLNI